MTLGLILTISIVLLYGMSFLWMERFIRKHIPNKDERKKYKKDKEINQSLTLIFAPLFVILGIWTYWDKNEGEMNGYEVTLFWVKILVLMSAVFLSVVTIWGLKQDLMELKDNKK